LSEHDCAVSMQIRHFCFSLVL